MHWRTLTTCTLALLLSACTSTWTRIDAQTAHYTTKHYEVDFPIDWVRATTPQFTLVTRDGIGIQRVMIEFHEHTKAFEKSEQDSGPDMLPSELADRYIAELRAADENGLPSLKVLANQPTTVGGQLGFALHLQFLSDDGLRYERLVTGLARESGFFAISYQAPTLHFFARDRGVYDRIVSSFRPI